MKTQRNSGTLPRAEGFLYQRPDRTKSMTVPRKPFRRTRSNPNPSNMSRGRRPCGRERPRNGRTPLPEDIPSCLLSLADPKGFFFYCPVTPGLTDGREAPKGKRKNHGRSRYCEIAQPSPEPGGHTDLREYCSVALTWAAFGLYQPGPAKSMGF